MEKMAALGKTRYMLRRPFISTHPFAALRSAVRIAARSETAAASLFGGPNHFVFCYAVKFT